MEKSEIFCSHPEKCSPAKLESSWLALSEGLSTGVSLPLTLTASLHLCHLQTQTVGVWDFRGEFSSVLGSCPEFGTLLSGQHPAPEPKNSVSNSSRRVAMTTNRYSRVQTGCCCQIPALKIRAKYPTSPPMRNGSVYNYFVK